MNRLISLSALGACLLLLTGCPASPAEVVQQYADHMKNKEYGEAFDLLAKNAQEQEGPQGDFESALEIEKMGMMDEADAGGLEDKLKEQESWVEGKTWKEVLEMEPRAYFIAKHEANGKGEGDKDAEPEFEVGEEKIDGDKATVKLTIKVGDESLETKAELVKEDGSWRLAKG